MQGCYHILGLLTGLLMTVAASAQSWDREYIESVFADRMLAPIEGVWQFPKDGAKMAIVKADADCYNIYLLDSPRLDLKPGLLIGTAVSTAKPNYFDGTLQSKALGKLHKMVSQTVTFTVTDTGRLLIKPYKTGYGLSFKRWLYYLLRISIVDNNHRPEDLNGARRIYPFIITDHLPICL